MSQTKDKSVLAESQEFRNLRWKAEWKRDRWLRARGWEQTCETPGSYWMWKKLWKGRDGKETVAFLVDTDTAERIQTNWDAEQDYQEHPENYED